MVVVGSACVRRSRGERGREGERGERRERGGVSSLLAIGPLFVLHV